MRLSDHLDPRFVLLDLPATGRSEAFAAIVSRLAESGRVEDAEEFLASLEQREAQGSTAIGRGMAIPHARCKRLKRIVVAMARLRAGIDFAAEDGEPVELIFLLGTPEDQAGEYLKVLGRLSKLLKQNGLRQQLLRATSPQAVLETLEKAEDQLA